MQDSNLEFINELIDEVDSNGDGEVSFSQVLVSNMVRFLIKSSEK